MSSFTALRPLTGVRSTHDGHASTSASPGPLQIDKDSNFTSLLPKTWYYERQYGGPSQKVPLFGSIASQSSPCIASAGANFPSLLPNSH